ncbi:ABC transporter permease subunit [Rheinheimera sp. F8]|uniref:ABC transporter permease subunit n=1 Tax=Rheinheimera sp. F8 TaxID=1763998 RepID=UPI00074483D7|nr:ABC transporter permease subunit [Rheinheimera sp. F8]ALZ75112.1 peptide ABC transporter permease [Rheinheimera sp. F8]ALZ76462.1 peptide ABC transporter permease [Rheinheimera sp. F8]
MKKLRLYYEEYNKKPYQLLWRHFMPQHFALFGLIILSVLVLLAIISPFISPHDPYLQNSELLLLAPSWQGNGLVSYPFGTDDLGRDLMSRLMLGASYSFGLAILAVLGSMIVGLILGALAGMTRGVQSSIFNHLLDLALTIPSLLLAIVIVAVLGPGLMNTIWAIMLALLPQFVHGVGNAIQQQLKQDYVVAYRLDGANNWQILWSVVLPNLWEPVSLLFTMALSTAILDIAALGFLGLGAQAPTPEWGSMVADALDSIYLAPWTVALPGLLIFITVLSINLVGDGLRKAMKKRRES